MTREEINVFKLEKPKSFLELLEQVETITDEVETWLSKLDSTIGPAQNYPELISEDMVNDAFHNISQNIIKLSELIQKKVRGE